MSEQLNMLADGAQPVDQHLGVTQRAVMRVLRRVGTLTVDEAGAIAHAGRGKHAVDERCGWCAPDGAPIVRALLERGLAEKNPAGGIRLPQPPAASRADDVDPFPEGF